MAAMLILCAVPLAASAADDEKAVSAKDNLTVSVRTDNINYGTFDSISVTVKVENTGDGLVTNVNSGAYVADCLLLNGESPSLGMGDLCPGESKTYSFTVVPKHNASGLSIFSRIILFIRNLFLKTSDFPATGIRDIYKSKGSGNFTVSGAPFSISAYATASAEYEQANDLSKEEIVDIYNNAVKAELRNPQPEIKYVNRNTVNFVSYKSESLDNEISELFKNYDFGIFYVEFPSKGETEYDDVESASAYRTEAGYVVRLNIKPQKFVNGASQEGPVMRSINGVVDVDDISSVWKELGIELVSGEKTFEIEISDLVIGCSIDENGKMTDGLWEYDLTMKMGAIVFRVGRYEITVPDGISASVHSNTVTE